MTLFSIEILVISVLPYRPSLAISTAPAVDNLLFERPRHDNLVLFLMILEMYSAPDSSILLANKYNSFNQGGSQLHSEELQAIHC